MDKTIIVTMEMRVSDNATGTQYECEWRKSVHPKNEPDAEFESGNFVTRDLSLFAFLTAEIAKAQRKDIKKGA